jgi:glycosyltransferase involved in cell wall biosynthesis
MIIGIDASRAFVKNRTGIEEYSYQVIKNLRNCLRDVPVFLYLDPRVNKLEYIDFELPVKWRTKFLQAPLFWTQVRLSMEMLLHAPDILFVPAHTVPLIHPKDTIVTIHGLEYEFCPEAYSPFERFYMRWVIRKSCLWARTIIAVSENTKKDLERLYDVSVKKLKVIYEGYSNDNFQFPISNFQRNPKSQIPNIKNTQYSILNTQYLLFVGRLEERKNIVRIVEAFEIIKKKYNVDHKLILVGKFGFGGEKIKEKIDGSEYRVDIILTGYVSDDNKYYLLANADAFLFPTIYEGFGLPILEAQSVGTPVVTSNVSSMPEVCGESAVLVDPMDSTEIAEATYKLISDESHKNDIIEKGYENVKRFSWEKCAREVANIMQILE